MSSKMDKSFINKPISIIHMDIEQNLQSLGLTNSEIKIYLELLKLGTLK